MPRTTEDTVSQCTNAGKFEFELNTLGIKLLLLPSSNKMKSGVPKI